VRELRYRTVHEDLIAALPELRRPYERLFADWDDFDGEPPGQYIVFPDSLGTLLQVVLTLDEGTPGRDALLRRALDFAETMLGCPEEAVEGVAIDSVAETLENHPSGRQAAERFGGPRLNAWFALYSDTYWDGQPDDEIIDLWGVRAELDVLLPGTPLDAIPGISHPADYLALGSLDEARAVDDGRSCSRRSGLRVSTWSSARPTSPSTDAGLDQAAKDIARLRRRRGSAGRAGTPSPPHPDWRARVEHGRGRREAHTPAA
jgi:hypothetical protein